MHCTQRGRDQRFARGNTGLKPFDPCPVKKAHFAPAVAALLLFAVRAFAGDDMTLRTAAQIGSAPKFVESAEPGEKVTGICADLYRAMEKAQPGLHSVGDQKWLPAVRIESEIAAGDLDIACAITRTEARGHQFDFVEPPLFSFDFRLAVRSDDDIDIRGWDDVRRLAPDNVILVNHGWGYVSRLADIAGLRIHFSGPTP